MGSNDVMEHAGGDMDALAPPSEHLDPRARTMWYVSEGFEMAAWTVVVVAIAVALTRFSDISTTWTWVVAAVILIGSLI
ncbi:MAG TPA: hypothetical protein VD767_08140, partial [Thermomicrobiales bacterium]|nr:hypothetical protein [Thermomicrobiales bacterium]